MSRELLEPASISALERQLLIAGGASSQSKPKIQPVGTSPLLSQLKQFLPKMEQANAELQQKLQECDPAELDIEHIPEQEEGEGPVIQMDLACGLLELHDDAAVAAAQRAIAAGGEVTVETYDGGTDSDSDSDEDSSDGSSGCSDGSDDDADVSADDVAAGSSQGCLRGAAAASNTAAAAAGNAVTDAMEEDDEAEEAEAEASADGVPEQEQQQQQKGKQRRKLKPKRPMIVELS